MPGPEVAEFRQEAGISVRHLANVENDRGSAVNVAEHLLELGLARKIVFTAELNPFNG